VHIDSLQIKVEKSEAANVLKDERIKSFEKELDVLNRAFDIQDRYETPRSGDRGTNNHRQGVGTSAIQVEREKMRSLYYELGKRQADAHSLTLTLADSSLEIDHLKSNLKEEQLLRVIMDKKIATLQNQFEELIKQKDALSEEFSQCQIKMSNSKDLNGRMDGQNKDLSKRLSETRTAFEATITEKESLVFELSSLLYASQMEAVSLNGKVEELKQSVTHMQSSSELTDQRTSSTLNKAIAEKKILADSLQEAEMMKPQIAQLRQQLNETINEKEMTNKRLQMLQHSSKKEIVETRSTAEDLQSELGVIQKQLRSLQAREGDLEEERLHALSTLQRTLEAAKSLTVKLQSEKDKRVKAEERANKAERLAESLQRAKEHVSSAVLDALHQEKSKSIRLEKVLQQMANNRDRDHIPNPDHLSSSTVKTPVHESLSGSPDTLQDRLDRVRGSPSRSMHSNSSSGVNQRSPQRNGISLSPPPPPSSSSYTSSSYVRGSPLPPSPNRESNSINNRQERSPISSFPHNSYYDKQAESSPLNSSHSPTRTNRDQNKIPPSLSPSRMVVEVNRSSPVVTDKSYPGTSVSGTRISDTRTSNTYPHGRGDLTLDSALDSIPNQTDRSHSNGKEDVSWFNKETNQPSDESRIDLREEKMNSHSIVDNLTR
jgi:chromosome segregation ATPase